MPLFQNATFLTSAHKLSDLPPANGIEVAFAGRSNAGKSSALNTLANHNRLAYVSKQPGRTQLINFFTLGGDRHLVDLPGYGYAKVPESMRNHWQTVLAKYLAERESLIGLVIVMDSRHPLTKLDRQMLDWFNPSGQPIHILLTKCDKLSPKIGKMTLEKTLQELHEVWGDHITAQLFSSSKKQGVEEAEAMIANWFDEADAYDAIAMLENEDDDDSEDTAPSQP